MKIKRFNKKANIIPLLFGILLIITVFYFGFFMDSTENKISGAVIGMESVSGMVTEKGIYQSTRWEDLEEGMQQWLLEQWKQGEPKYTVDLQGELEVESYESWTVEQVKEKYGDQAATEYSKYSNEGSEIYSNPLETFETFDTFEELYFEELSNGNILVTKTQSTGMGDGLTFKTIKEINPEGVVVSSEFISNDKILSPTDINENLGSELNTDGSEITIGEYEDAIPVYDKNEQLMGYYSSSDTDGNDKFYNKNGDELGTIDVGSKTITYSTAGMELLSDWKSWGRKTTWKEELYYDPVGQEWISKSDAQKKADEYLKETGKGEEDISEIKIGRSVETLTQQKASALVSNMLRMLLGKFGFDKVSEICKAESNSSEPSLDQPSNVNSGSVNSLTTDLDQAEQFPECTDSNKTTLTVQGIRGELIPGFSYNVSWTIKSCKEDVQYIIYLANSETDREAIKSGTAKKGEIEADTKEFAQGKSYDELCIQVSDNTLVDDGYACFPIV